MPQLPPEKALSRFDLSIADWQMIFPAATSILRTLQPQGEFIRIGHPVVTAAYRPTQQPALTYCMLFPSSSRTTRSRGEHSRNFTQFAFDTPFPGLTVRAKYLPPRLLKQSPRYRGAARSNSFVSFVWHDQLSKLMVMLLPFPPAAVQKYCLDQKFTEDDAWEWLRQNGQPGNIPWVAGWSFSECVDRIVEQQRRPRFADGPFAYENTWTASRGDETQVRTSRPSEGKDLKKRGPITSDELYRPKTVKTQSKTDDKTWRGGGVGYINKVFNALIPEQVAVIKEFSRPSFAELSRSFAPDLISSVERNRMAEALDALRAEAQFGAKVPASALPAPRTPAAPPPPAHDPLAPAPRRMIIRQRPPTKE